MLVEKPQQTKLDGSWVVVDTYLIDMKNHYAKDTCKASSTPFAASTQTLSGRTKAVLGSVLLYTYIYDVFLQ